MVYNCPHKEWGGGLLTGPGSSGQATDRNCPHIGGGGPRVVGGGRVGGHAGGGGGGGLQTSP